MPRTVLLVSIAMLGLASGTVSKTEAASAAIDWQPWSADVFARAHQEHRLVLLDLEAIWCHWCHVMDATTYSDPRVIKLIRSGFIAVRVDQDARPDLSRRYEDYGWPATVVFDGSARELARRRGYLEPRELIPLLTRLRRHPSPEPDDVATDSPGTMPTALSDALLAELRRLDAAQYDDALGGWGSEHKLLHGAPEELALTDVDETQANRARKTLTAALALIDPVWGGAFQYSVRTWAEPHFEKIASAQATNLMLYSLSYARWQQPEYLKAAQQIVSYLTQFLTDAEGAFYTSQDADLVQGEHAAAYFALDDAARRKQGVPAIDRHVYAQTNGELIAALAFYAGATGDPEALARAARAAHWIGQHRSVEGGGFRHGDADPDGVFYLSDTLEMGAAFLRLYEVTADRAWLDRAEQAARFIASHFAGGGSGYVSNQASVATGLPPLTSRDENVRLARFAHALFRESDDASFRDIADTAMRYLSAPAVAKERPTAAMILAAGELAREPPHITVVGRKDDPAAVALHQAALALPWTYRRIDWWDRREGPAPGGIAYPELPTAAAFVCTGRSCSLPLRDPARLRQFALSRK